MLACWTLATPFFLRAFETSTVACSSSARASPVAGSIAAGVMAAVALLGKCWSIFLIAGFVAGALYHPSRRAYFRSWSPYVSAAAGLLLIAPHVQWLISTGFLPFRYAVLVHASDAT